MRLTRILTAGPLQSGADIPLSAGGAHHVSRVLRLRVGAALIVFDGTAGEYPAEIVDIAGDRVTVRLGKHRPGIDASNLNLTLVQGVSRGERMDWTLQKATELGVSRIVPVLTSRSVVRLDEKQATKKHAHWRSVLIGACEQSGRTRIPELAPAINLQDYFSTQSQSALRLVLSPTAAHSLATLGNVPPQVELLIGPEGGLDDDEMLGAQQAGFSSVRLGPRILRTETAAVVALSALQTLWGDLR